MQAEKTLLHRTAKDLAARGIPVFPCQENGKLPAIGKDQGGNGFRDATTDPLIIDAWWRINPNFNIGVCPHDVGWCVIDLDGQDGENALATLELEHGSLADTYEVRTPRGGRHLYYKGELPSTVRKIGASIDTRGVGGYILVPPSYVIDPEKGIDGPYEVTHDRPLADVSPWVAGIISRKNERHAAATSVVDDRAASDRGSRLLRDYVKRGHVARSGQGGNHRTYQVACELLNLGCSQDTARALLEEHWNPHCVPPWDSADIETFITNAASYAQNEAGAWASEPANVAFSQTSLDRAMNDDTPARRSRFYFEDDEEQDTAPDPVWLVKGLLPDCATVLWLGQKGSFKSFLVQHLSLALAADKETFGQKPERHGPTFYGAHEGRNAIKKPRKNAWKIAHGIEETIPFYVARAPFVIDQDQCEEFREAIRARLRTSNRKIAAIILDTVAKCMTGLNENDARDVGIFTAFCDSLRDEFECVVIAQHHLGKDTMRGGRGSSALAANFDTVITTTRKPKTLLVSVEVNNHKDAEEPEDAYHFRGQIVGPSLVFSPITATEHHDLATADDPFDKRKVGKALQELQAYGVDNAVTTAILAGSLAPGQENDTPDQAEAGKAKAARSLGGLAKSKLAAYCERTTGGLVWFLPPQEV